MEEYKIGEVFQFGKKKLKCIKGTRCSKCAMSDLGIGGCDWASKYVGACTPKDRADHTEVIFVEVNDNNDEI